jgi:hypothetical protein
MCKKTKAIESERKQKRPNRRKQIPKPLHPTSLEDRKLSSKGTALPETENFSRLKPQDFFDRKTPLDISVSFHSSVSEINKDISV